MEPVPVSRENPPSTGDIVTCLLEFPDATFTQLYQQPATCLAIFRLLPALSKQFVMRMLYLRHPLSEREMENWVLGQAPPGTGTAGVQQAQKAVAKSAIDGARKFKILLEAGHDLWKLNDSFRRHFQEALTGGGPESSFGSLAPGPDKTAVDISFLDHHAKTQWETLLQFMVGTPGAPRPSTLSVRILEESKLMRKAAKDEYSITHRGFQFLLQDVNSQVWALLLQYMSMVTNFVPDANRQHQQQADQPMTMNEVDVLSFLFLLSSMELGASYSVESLTETQKAVLDDMCNMGIVYRRRKKSSRFYPTRLATTLTNGKMAIKQAEGEGQGFILLETNFRIYAYTTSDLQIAILKLFVNVSMRFPNFVIGVMNRDSVLSAVSKGITADQIISFLTTNAHPLMHTRAKSHSTPLLPVTVVDQLRLWEMETQRFSHAASRLIIGFPNATAFDVMYNEALRLNAVLLKHNEGGTTDKRQWALVVKEEAFASVQSAWKEHRRVRAEEMKRRQAAAAAAAAASSAAGAGVPAPPRGAGQQAPR
ncbi:transcription factor Tfb2-domain-containing protein [Catenaria anguillulae PL171]|uniref:RNA polymerase II transcription factor B subunit 2 n=1 Tax=Catenaria anguillulae PL171 TaxID=765915 RepID=A0A1Y2HPN9_9FUNG|nr:transcription factor Tfb2-domain-containing protein [Catenaria anguillulae PL171]